MVVQFIRRFIQKHIFSDEFPLETRMLNMVSLLGLGIATAATVVRVALNNDLVIAAMMAGVVLAIIVFMVICNRFHLYRIGRWFFLIFLGDIVYPANFFLVGGLRGPMAAYFVLSIVLVFLLLTGTSRAVFLVIQLMVIAATFCAAYFFPHLVIPESLFHLLLDSIQAVSFSGLFIGLTFVFQNRLYLREKDKAVLAGREILRQDTLLKGVNETAAILLSAGSERHFEDALYRGMEMLARCVGATNINIWKNRAVNGRYYYCRIFSWKAMADGGEGQKMTALSFAYDDTFPFWEQKLSQGQTINGPVKNLSPAEIERLSLYGIKSILVVPVFLQQEFWGFVSYDDCAAERTFLPEEENILRSGSLLLANAVVRDEMTGSLIHAREAALQSSRAKSEFLANMSHEMRTPMNAIIGMTSIAKSADEIGRKDYCLKKIEDASTHLLGVINDILDISKIEANKFELSVEEFDFEKMLQKVVNVINFRIEEKQQRFHVNLDRKIPRHIVGDDQRIAQVITNLLSNAVKFTPDNGSIRLNAGLVSQEDDRCVIQIEVKDSGIGISAEQQARLFAAFEQADSSTSRRFGGTGLGLAISKRIVEMMNGRIRVESELGKGSSFFFTMQVTEAKGGRASLFGPDVNWSNIRLLAVDDDPEVRAFFTGFAEQIKVRCDTAAGGEEALALIEKNGSYNVYFIDWKMPGMNGIELSRRITGALEPAGTAGGKPVVIMISVVERAAMEQEAKGAGVTKFLSKPLFPSNIIDCINECLGGGVQSGEGEADAAVEDFGEFRILLAEDVEINREIVLTILEPTNLAIECAENGVEAVRMFTGDPDRYDMIFMDIQMPEMDGYEAARRIRAFEQTPADGAMPRRVPIIAMTANVFREDVENCLASGMDDHVGKPLDFDEVLDRLRRHLKKRDSRG
jgi:signal transduction histidine kinase/DNA-binding response OmpR family regulator